MEEETWKPWHVGWLRKMEVNGTIYDRPDDIRAYCKSYWKRKYREFVMQDGHELAYQIATNCLKRKATYISVV